MDDMRKKVTLPQMLRSREWRFEKRRALTRDFGEPLVCLTLNIAGPVKRFPLADRTFAEAKSAIECRLQGERLAFALCAERVDATGHCAFFHVDADPMRIKRLMCAIEQTHPLGRLMDIDVYESSGERLPRQALGLPARRCLICDNEAHACARSRAHGLEALRQATHKRMRDHFDARFCQMVQAAATRALLYELSATPKPGLVDRANCGAHTDMDFTSFAGAIAALSAFFYAFAQLGMCAADERSLFESLRCAGMQAEQDMLRATGGVNTHRGAIFALGLIAGACGLLHSREVPLTPDNLLQTCAQLAAFALADLRQLDPSRAKSHGERAYIRHGAGGARQEAANGFPSVRNIALPQLRSWLALGASANDASVAALLHLIAHVEDTNLLARSDLSRAQAIRKEVQERLNRTADLGDIIELAAALDGEYIRANLSPGGCADLLSAAWMLHFICTKEETHDVD